MNIEDFKAEFDRFAQTKAFALSLPEPPNSLEQISSFERSHRFRLPEQYRHVATTFGTGSMGFANLFSVMPGEHGIDEQRATAPELPVHFVPVSDNGCGDFYGFIVHNGSCLPTVYFADHESGYALTKTEFADLFEYLVRYAFNAA
jgi:hypothetical protein